MTATCVEPVPCVKIRSPHGYVDEDKKKLLRPIVKAKLGIDELEERWEMVGRDALVTFTVKERPPTIVGLADVAAAIDKCKEYEFIVGVAVRGRFVTISLDDDSPHIACSAGSGAGKSILAMMIAIQVLRKGGRVLIIDRKGSHRWARGLSGVTYCTKVADMHHALIGVSDLADARNTQAMEEEEGWDPGERIFVIFEEMNATIAQLRAYWDRVRDKTDPRFSPAIQAFRDIMCMGRSAKVNLFGVAQMLTANTTGGPAARENFGVRCLARYTANNWKMLVPQCAMPRRSKTRGRWQIVIGDDVYETQVPFPATPDGRLDIEAVRDFAAWTGQGADPRTEPPTVGPVTVPETRTAGRTQGQPKPDNQNRTPEPARYTLAEAARQPWCPLNYDALRKVRSRADTWPTPTMRGKRETWTEDQLRTALGDRIPTVTS